MSIYVSNYHLALVRANAYDQLFTENDWSEKGFLHALDMLEWTFVGFLTDPNDSYFRMLVQRALNVVFEVYAGRSWSNIQDLLSVAYMRTMEEHGQLTLNHVLLERTLNEQLIDFRGPRVGG